MHKSALFIIFLSLTLPSTLSASITFEINDSNQNILCPIVQSITENAYKKAWALAPNGTITDKRDLSLAIVVSQPFWDLYPSALKCPSVSLYEQQFNQLGINKDNAILDNNNVIELVKFVTQTSQSQGASLQQSSVMFGNPVSGGKIKVAGLEVPDDKNFTLSIPPDALKNNKNILATPQANSAQE